MPAAAGGTAVGSSRSRVSRSSAAVAAACVSRRARCMPGQACGPWAKVRCCLALAVGGSNRSGSGTPPGRGWRRRGRRSRSRPARSRPRRARTSRVAKRSTRTTAGSRRNDSSMALAISDRSASTALHSSGSASRWANRLVVIPSQVSIPPNIITPVFDTISSTESVAWRRRARRRRHRSCAPPCRRGRSRRVAPLSGPKT